MSHHPRQRSVSHSYLEKRINNYTYNTQNILGKGSYSSVYLGTDLNTNTAVAIKVIENHLLRDEFINNLINQECRIMKSLTHPNVVKLHEVLSTTNHTYIIQEYCNQSDLSSLITSRGTFSESEAVFIFEQILEGFKELLNHSIIHRDIKPANILIDSNIFKIADFGFAIHVEGLADNLKSSLVGTPLYMSPQCLRGEFYSTKNDIWSMGVILYEMLYGDVPWPVSSKFELIQAFKMIPLRFNPQRKISANLKDFIERCLKIDERERIDWEEIYKHPLFKGESIEEGMTFTRDRQNKLIGIEYGKESKGENMEKMAEVTHLQTRDTDNEGEINSRIFIVLGIFENISIMNHKMLSTHKLSGDRVLECENYLLRYVNEIVNNLLSTENANEFQKKLMGFSNWEKLRKELEKKSHYFMNSLKKVQQYASFEPDNKKTLVDSLKKNIKDLINEGNHRLYMEFIEVSSQRRGNVDEGLFQYINFMISGLKIIEENNNKGFDALLGSLLEKKLLPTLRKGVVQPEELKKLREVVYAID